MCSTSMGQHRRDKKQYTLDQVFDSRWKGAQAGVLARIAWLPLGVAKQTELISLMLNFSSSLDHHQKAVWTLATLCTAFKWGAIKACFLFFGHAFRLLNDWPHPALPEHGPLCRLH